MPNIVLSSAVRSNVLQLQSIEKNQGTIQNRLATGLRVSSALDDPRNFFQAQGLNFRANDLNRRLDGMGLAIKTLQAADKGITALTKLVESMSAIVKDAQDTPANRATLQANFNSLRTQMQNLARDSGFNGINLLEDNSATALVVNFNEESSGASASNLNIQGVAWAGTNNPAGIAEAANWADADPAGATAVGLSEAAIRTGLQTLRQQAATFGNNLTLVQVREGFTKDIVNTLKSGADGLTLADQNEEAANLLALNTRQQLSQQALALTTQAEQSILRLLS